MGDCAYCIAFQLRDWGTVEALQVCTCSPYDWEVEGIRNVRVYE